MNELAVQSVFDLIGDTPVLSLSDLLDDSSVNLFAKLELVSPTYSVKDRIALPMIEDGIAQGKINPDTTIVAATGGNSGVALSLVGVVKKLKLILFMPEDFSLERRKMLEGYGAKLVVTPKEAGLQGAILKAQEYVAKNKNCYLLDQFDHEINIKAHEEGIAAELIHDFPEGIDVFITGVGTGGTITGVAKVLKSKFPNIKIIAVEPENSAVISGGKPGVHRIQQLGYGFIPKNLNRDLIDDVVTVTDEEAFNGMKELSSKKGVLAGLSSGAHLYAAKKAAKNLSSSQTMVMLICDGGQRYFSLNRK